MRYRSLEDVINTLVSSPPEGTISIGRFEALWEKAKGYIGGHSPSLADFSTFYQFDMTLDLPEEPLSAREMEEITKNFAILQAEMHVLNTAMTDAYGRGEASITHNGPISGGALHILRQSTGISVSKVNDSCYVISWAQHASDSGATGKEGKA